MKKLYLNFAVLIIGLGLGYFLGTYMLDQDNDEDTIQGAGSIKPEYAFNQTLNTCLSSGGVVNDKVVTFWIVDSYTNEELVFFSTVDNEVFSDTSCADCVKSLPEYDIRKSDLMGFN